ncbi:MAG TPA: hypothetical protein VFT38_23500 [Vicinamibacteria bacterium]|nr:hypothetical protein [Vicinamibacteria bacterium]
MSRTTIALGIALTGLTAAVGAQSPDHSGPPPVLTITREEIKPGHMATHEKLNAAFVSAVSRTPSESRWLGLVPVSGDENTTIFLSAFGNFAQAETQRKADEDLLMNTAFKSEIEALDKQAGDVHAAQRTTYARYRPDLSFHPATMEQVAQSRYFGITTVRIKYNRVPDYVEYVKAVNAAREKARLPIQLVVYQVTSGAQAGTFVSFRPLKSLKTWDDDYAATAEAEKAMTEAYGGEEAARKVRLQGADLVMVSDNAVYAMNPKISRPAPEFANYDLAFWAPKAAETRTAAAAKPGASKQPASVKKEAPKQ